MIELYQFAWSPFCLVQRRILEFAQVRFRSVAVSSTDRALIWKLTRQRYYQVPVLRDGRHVIFETAEDSQVIAKYLDNKLRLGLFPPALRGLQTILWQDIEGEIESRAFRLNDIYFREFVPARERLPFIRHKERKFGRGCLDQWRAQQADLCAQLEARLAPYEQMLLGRPFLLGDRPHFVDFDLHGMLGNFLHTGHYELPAAHPQIRAWFTRLQRAQARDFST